MFFALASSIALGIHVVAAAGAQECDSGAQECDSLLQVKEDKSTLSPQASMATQDMSRISGPDGIGDALAILGAIHDKRYQSEDELRSLTHALTELMQATHAPEALVEQQESATDPDTPKIYVDGHTPVPVPRTVMEDLPMEMLYSYDLGENAAANVNGTHVFIPWGMTLRGHFVRDYHMHGSYEYGTVESRWCLRGPGAFPDTVVGSAEKLHTYYHEGAWPETSLQRVRREQAARWSITNWTASQSRASRTISKLMYWALGRVDAQIIDTSLDPNHLRVVRAFAAEPGVGSLAARADALMHNLTTKMALASPEPSSSATNCAHLEAPHLEMTDEGLAIPLDMKLVTNKGQLVFSPLQRSSYTTGVTTWTVDPVTNKLNIYYGASAFMEMIEPTQEDRSFRYYQSTPDGEAGVVPADGRVADYGRSASAWAYYQAAQLIPLDYEFLYKDPAEVCPPDVYARLTAQATGIDLRSALDGGLSGLVDLARHLLDVANCGTEFLRGVQYQSNGLDFLEVMGFGHFMVEAPPVWRMSSLHGWHTHDHLPPVPAPSPDGDSDGPNSGNSGWSATAVQCAGRCVSFWDGNSDCSECLAHLGTLSPEIGRTGLTVNYMMEMLDILNHPDYVTVFCGSAENLPTCEFKEGFPGDNADTIMGHARVSEMVRLTPINEWDGIWWRGNELGLIINNPLFWSRNGISPPTVVLGASPKQHAVIRPYMEEVFTISAGTARYNQVQEIVTRRVRDFLDERLARREGFSVPTDILALVHQILWEVTFGDRRSWEDAQAFVELQGTLVDLGTVSSALPGGLQGVFNGYADQVGEYVDLFSEIVRSKWGAQIESQDCQPSESCVKQLASAIWDGFYSAGGLSVPTNIHTGLGLLFSNDAANPFPAGDYERTEMGALRYFWENVRFFSAVVGFPHWETRPPCAIGSAGHFTESQMQALNHSNGGTEPCPMPVPFQDGGRINQYAEGHRVIANLAVAQRDPRVWGPDANEFRIRDFGDYINSVGFAEPAENHDIADGGMNRVCPGKDLAMMIGTAFFHAFNKDEWYTDDEITFGPGPKYLDGFTLKPSGLPCACRGGMGYATECTGHGSDEHWCYVAEPAHCHNKEHGWGGWWSFTPCLQQ